MQKAGGISQPDLIPSGRAGPLFDSAKGLGHTDPAMTATASSIFSTPATGIVVVTITILPL